jgi:hypothetical protein
MVAAAAAVASVLLNRLVLPLIGGSVAHDRALMLAKWFALPRNLAAIAGIGALTGAVYHVMRVRAAGPLRQRMAVAAFAGIFLPTTAFATLVPAARMSRELVVFGIGSGTLLAVTVAVVAFRWRGPTSLRMAVGLFGASAFLALATFLVPMLLPPPMWKTSNLARGVLGGATEATYLLAAVAALPAIRPLYPPSRARVGRLVGAVVGLAVVFLFAWGLQALRADDVRILIYGVQRLDLWLVSAPWAYAPPLAVGFGAAAAALTSRAPTDRQAGAGLLLLLSAGVAPKAPADVMMMALGLTLMGRALVAQAMAIEASRAGQP